MTDEISDYTKECNTESFLESFNIDTGADWFPLIGEIFFININFIVIQNI